MDWVKENWFRLGLLVFLLLILALAYNYLVAIPKLRLSQQAESNRIERADKLEGENIERVDREMREILRNSCLMAAEDNYFEYMKLNGKEQEDGSILAANMYWDIASKNRKEARDLCFDKFPNN
jgi:hypothetical protein